MEAQAFVPFKNTLLNQFNQQLGHLSQQQQTDVATTPAHSKRSGENQVRDRWIGGLCGAQGCNWIGREFEEKVFHTHPRMRLLLVGLLDWTGQVLNYYNAIYSSVHSLPVWLKESNTLNQVWNLFCLKFACYSKYRAVHITFTVRWGAANRRAKVWFTVYSSDSLPGVLTSAVCCQGVLEKIVEQLN